MSAIGIALIALTCSFGGAWVGVLLRERLPDAHLSQDTAEVVKLSDGPGGNDGGARARAPRRVGRDGIQRGSDGAANAGDRLHPPRSRAPALRARGRHGARAAAQRRRGSRQPGHVQGAWAARKRQVVSGFHRSFVNV